MWLERLGPGPASGSDIDLDRSDQRRPGRLVFADERDLEGLTDGAHPPPDHGRPTGRRQVLRSSFPTSFSGSTTPSAGSAAAWPGPVISRLRRTFSPGSG